MRLVIPIKQRDAFFPVIVDVARQYIVEFESLEDLGVVTVCYKKKQWQGRDCDFYTVPDAAGAALLYAALELVAPGTAVLVGSAERLKEAGPALRPVAEMWLKLQPQFEPIPPGKYYMERESPATVYGIGAFLRRDEYAEVQNGSDLVVFRPGIDPKYVVAGAAIYEVSACKRKAPRCYALPEVGRPPPYEQVKRIYGMAKAIAALMEV